MKVLLKMVFGSRWMNWMWWCISTVKFSILINGVLAEFFSNSKGLRQGDPLSPYLFVLGMEVLSTLLRRAGEGGFLSGCKLRGRGGGELTVSHLLFADDTIIFCKTRKEQLTNLSWILAWFEAASGLRINFAKSVLIPVGEVDELEELVVELGENEEKTSLVEKTIHLKGGRITLIKSTLASIPIYLLSLIHIPNPKEEGGLGIRKIDLLNKALLGKWIWRYAYGRTIFGKGVVPNFPPAVHLGGSKECHGHLGQGGWNLRFARDFNDWELDQIRDMLNLLRDFRTSPEEDSPRGGRSSLWIGFKEGDGNSLTDVLLCGCEEENVNHILLHYIVVKTLWEIVLAIFGVQWMFPESVKEGVHRRGVLFSLRLFGVARDHLRVGLPEHLMHKNRLQEYTQRSAIPLPIYQTVNEGFQHAPKFRSTVLVDGATYTSPNTFSHRKAAEQDVARLALEFISKKIKDEGCPLIREVCCMHHQIFEVFWVELG
ncbi:putative mitochondrial protein [Vitis vinifera]|nr:putative mitochondrial protein [Vitis vinifera]